MEIRRKSGHHQALQRFELVQRFVQGLQLTFERVHKDGKESEASRREVKNQSNLASGIMGAPPAFCRRRQPTVKRLLDHCRSPVSSHCRWCS